ncbi:helix-turn-helix transcriptional regulator [Actinomyces bowdenii]|uniref:heat shock protein transcriptional repressor HspR n=1 Tax=Actinomyces bowdenii TaxID=131109 RepID=UPI00214AE135|nr:helix-turn-helix transcriptional regulator [Actinomyces bowdenii]MCR2052127.1 helix-turn-helix transcriptional regulator [Actinomyces bowdenii]
MSARRRAGQGLGFLAEDAGERAVYVVSVAAELAGMHPQTLRQYDRLGLVRPARTRSRGRRYSHRDVERLRRIQALSQEGVNLEGIRRILDLEARVAELEAANAGLRAREAAVQRIFAAAADGEVQVVPARAGRSGRQGEAAPAGPGSGGGSVGGAVRPAAGPASGPRGPVVGPGTAIILRRS